MAEPNNQEVKSRRDMAVERLRERYPDKEFNDDEAIFGQISDDYDELDGQLNSYKEREQGMVDMMTKDPRMANFLAAWHQGENPLVAMMRMYGPELKDALDDPELQDKLAEAQTEYLDRLAESKELNQQFDDNVASSIAERDAFQQEKGLSDEQMDEIHDRLEQKARDIIVGKFTRDMYEDEYMAMNHDSDVAAAADEAEVRGRNAKINETLRKRGEGDGVAPLGGSAGKVNPQRPKSILQLAREEEMGM